VESNPGTFGVKVTRIKPKVEDDDINIRLTLGDARRLEHLLDNGLPNNPYNSIWALRERLLSALRQNNVHGKDLG